MPNKHYCRACSNDLSTAHSRSCWRVKKTSRLVVCCHDRLVGEKNARDCIRRANQHARWLGTPGKSAKSFEARQGRRQNATPSFGVPQRTAKHHLSLQHTAHYTLHNALRPLPPTFVFVSSTDPALQHIRLARLNYCCKPPLLKVRLSIRGALNPLYPASAGPGHHAALHTHGPDCLAAAG